MINDLIMLEEKHLIEKYKSKKDLPRKIRLEACTLCQLNCPDCYMRKEPEKVKNGCGLGYLTLNNFKKLVDNNKFEEIELSNSGEIFLNPDLIKIMEYAYKKGIRLTAKNGVNLNNLSDEMAEALIKYQFQTIIVSIDGASQETYSQYRVGGNYDNVINNIKKIQHYKKKYFSKYPFIEWKFIVFGHNEHEISQAKIQAKKLKLPIFFKKKWDSEYSTVKNVKKIEEETGILFSGTRFEYIHKGYSINSERFYCEGLWEAPQINWDGQILGCCCMFNDNFGENVFKDGLIKSLNNPKLIYAKNMLTGNAESIDGIPCTNCDIFKKIKELNLKIEKPILTEKYNFSIRKFLRKLKHDLLIFYYEKIKPRLRRT